MSDNEPMMSSMDDWLESIMCIDNPRSSTTPVNWRPGKEFITAHFKWSEFRCKDGTDVPSEYRNNCKALVENLEVLRKHVGSSIKIVCGYRTPSYNTKPGQVPTSQHLYAKAADIRVKNMSVHEVHDAIETLIRRGSMKQGGLGAYPDKRNNFVHYDIRGKKARW